MEPIFTEIKQGPEQTETKSPTEVSEDDFDEIKVLLQELAEEKDYVHPSVISDPPRILTMITVGR